MSSLQVYERGAVFLNGVLLLEVMTVSVDSDPKLNPIDTMQKGFAGVSPGSEHTKVSISCAVPRSGFDFAYLKAMQGTEIVELVLFGHAEKSASKGFLTQVKQSYGADKAATVDVEFMGAPLETSSL